MQQIIIREALNEELPMCAALIRESFLTVAEEFAITQENAPTNPAFISDERVEYEKRHGNDMYVLLADGELAGFAALADKGEGVSELKRLAVPPRFRHRGYGRSLLDFAAKKAAEAGAKKLTIGIIEENKVLKDWYVAYGFVPTGTAVFEHLPFTVGFLELSIRNP